MTLTEQWKKGELEQGYYYTKYTPKVGKPFVEIELKNYLLDLAKVRDVDTVEVLSPVPSYKEWQELKEFADYSLHNRDELTRQINFWMDKHTQIEKENQQLKELLRKAKGIITAYRLTGNQSTYPNSDMKECVAKITNAIGEKK